MDKVLVTGGTGLIGVELVEALCRMGYRPRVLTRRRHRAALLSSSPVEVVCPSVKQEFPAGPDRHVRYRWRHPMHDRLTS